MNPRLAQAGPCTIFYRYLGRGRVYRSPCYIWEIWCLGPDGRLATTSSCFPVRYGFRRSEREALRDGNQFARTRIETNGA
ncbi:hypothetical protein [Gloeobacter kilaueensis]|uniref:Uncharacterized protein n=1 Tax=Gloeobacter kilaueensis (strain ATCC BAA-2537 / CCAP 1431/1 / ULC 316 / JS1) TaxID=1183438 RepID=U5QMI6_GLOK1|nr:hypothetical protein [Gloeobacter kilaueensis]AGY60217.1 hypothetical protein GKIL_3971 [Gloeobacter kilaueensis JS1]